MAASRQTLCLQYEVTGELDGVTPAPELAAPRSTGDLNQMYRPREAVDKLGLIDPDFTPAGGATGIANRLITYLWISGAEPGDPGARVAVVDPEDPNDPLLQEEIADLAGKTDLYTRSGIFVGQASALQVRGLRPPPGGLLKVRLYVDLLDDPLTTATVLQALCCAEGGGGGGGDLPDVEDDGLLVVPDTEFFNFVGPGVSVTSGPGARANISIPGGATPPLQTTNFNDNATVDLLLGPVTEGYFALEGSISNALGASKGIRADVGVSGTGAVASILQVDSNVPLVTLSFSAVVAAGQVYLRLIGSGPGTPTTINYRVVDSILRAFP